MHNRNHSPDRHSPLTPVGREQARLAGEFLRAQGVTPDLVVVTSTRRTKETAEGVMKALGIEREVHDVGHGWGAGASLEQIEAGVRQWASAASPAPDVVLLCGHRMQQATLVKALGISPVPARHHGAVIVVEIDDGGEWRLVGTWAGS